MFFAEPNQWWMLGHALGLTPYLPSAGFGTQASFRQHRRALGAPVTAGPKWAHWLYGQRGGHEVLVLTYETGSGSHRSTHTAAIVRIDPPLFLGVSIAQDGFFSELFSGVDVQLGAPAYDSELRLGAFDAERLRELLLSPAAGDPTPVLQALTRGVRAQMHVTDSTVVFSMSGYVTDAGAVAAKLDLGVWIADALSRRRGAMAPTAAEARHRAEWQAYAEQRNLAFEPERMRLRGEVSGARIEVALETNGARLQTGITVEWPQTLALNLRVRKSTSFSFLANLFGGSVKTGYPDFDAVFDVQGQPAQHVGAIFGSPELRDSLIRLAPHASEVTMNGAGCFWLWPVPVITTAELDAHVGLALRMSTALFGGARSAGPFR